MGITGCYMGHRVVTEVFKGVARVLFVKGFYREVRGVLAEFLIVDYLLQTIFLGVRKCVRTCVKTPNMYQI